MPPGPEALSEYELERERNIAANKRHLASLGLDGPFFPPTKRAAVRRQRPSADPDWLPRRSGRRGSRNEPSDDSASGDEASGEEASGDESDGDDIPKPVRATKKPPPKPTPQPVRESTPAPAIVIEAAKTGRSKCRRCLEPIQQGEKRVGMESWMVGRQVMVWQHPACFLDGVAISTETSGRGKCKLTKAPFVAGERRISCTAHTTTSNFKLAAVAPSLRALLALVPGRKLEHIEGYGLLDADEAALLKQAGGNEEVAAVPAVGATPEQTEAVEAGPAAAQGGSQPKKGAVSRVKGRVAWRFAGHVCSGTLLPAQETKTHCYARTHKGNTKTLTKGGASWWLV